MRHACKPPSPPPSAKPSLPAPAHEGPVQRFTQDDAGLVAERWRELSSRGMKDWKICTTLGKELGRGPKSIEGKLRELRAKGLIGENPNRQKKDFSRRELIIIAREQLAESGLCDGAIARKLAEKTSRSVSSLKTTICALVREGALPANRNNQLENSSLEISRLAARREKLMSVGLNDTSIARVVASESSDRNANSIRRRLWLMVAEADLPENGNEAPASRELENIIARRAALMAEGMGDREIAERIGEEMGRLPQTIGLLIWRAVRMGGCQKNRN